MGHLFSRKKKKSLSHFSRAGGKSVTPADEQGI